MSDFDELVGIAGSGELSAPEVKELVRIYSKDGLQGAEMWLEARKVRLEKSSYPLDELLRSIDFTRYLADHKTAYRNISDMAPINPDIHPANYEYCFGPESEQAMDAVREAYSCLSLFSVNHLDELRERYRVYIAGSVRDGFGILRTGDILREYDENGNVTIDSYSREQLERVLDGFLELRRADIR